MCKARELINQISNGYDEIEQEFHRLNKELSKCDLMQQDILHMIEFDTFNAAEGYFYAKKLKEIREERRNIKNDLDLVNVALTTLRGIHLKAKVNEISKKVIQKEQHQTEKIYTPRILKAI